jgi:hypothetical protein
MDWIQQRQQSRVKNAAVLVDTHHVPVQKPGRVLIVLMLALNVGKKTIPTKSKKYNKDINKTILKPGKLVKENPGKKKR